MPRKILEQLLRVIAKAVLFRYQPAVIAVTGSVGKTSTKEAVAVVLRQKFSVRKSERNLNTAVGVPLTILGGVDAKRNPFLWLRNLWRGLRYLLGRSTYPSILVLELGADRPGDIRDLVAWVKPEVGVVTAIGEIPVHVEFYSGTQAVAEEKSYVVKALPQEGWAILNFDDLAVYAMKEVTRAKVLTFGFGEGADIKISDYSVRMQGITFRLEYSGSFVPVRLNECFGKPQAYAAAAAAAVGITRGLNLVEVAEMLADYKSLPGRMKLYKGVKETWIIDDTYNASPLSTHAALETLRDFPATRRIAVLGDMLEIGKFTTEAHETVGHFAATFCDHIVAVGARAFFIKEGALARDFPPDRILYFSDSQVATKPVELLLQPGDAVLVKGSRSMKMERVVQEIVASPAISE
ncbi:MAG: hypothetical protein HYS57_00475 [Parcubacteria group bacterium]|nr:hypothetical protein [Parcubacteria group bacterium]